MFNIPQKFDGISVLPAAEFNNFIDELKNIVTSSGQALTGADITQIAKAIANYVMNGNYFTDSGVANAYILGVVGAKLAPTGYTDGFTVAFKVGNTNTGASNVNVAGLGVKTIKKNNGADDVESGDLPIGNIVEIVYNLSGDYFELTRTEFISADFLRRDRTNNVIVGYTTTAYSLGNSGTGTITPRIAHGHIQTLTINGNFILAAPTDAQSGFIEIEMTNANPGGYTIDTSAYTIIENGYDDSNGKVNIARILKVGSNSYLSMAPVPLPGASAKFTNYNAIANPTMYVWNEGTTFAGASNGLYTAEMFRYTKLNTTGVQTISQDTSVPGVDFNTPVIDYSLLVTTTTADNTVDPGDLVTIAQRIEGKEYANLAQRDMTLSFWVKSSITGTYCIGAKNSGSDRSYVAEYVINSANTWERKTITIPASPASGTWNYTNGIGLDLNFTLMAGSTYQTAAGSWATGNFLGTSNQTNFLGTNGATFYLTAVQLEAGTVATPLFLDNISDAISRTLRYYNKSYSLNVIPGTNTEDGMHDLWCTKPSGNDAGAGVKFSVIMRTAPTVSIYSKQGTPGKVSLYDTGVDQANNCQGLNISDSGYLNVVSTSGLVANTQYYFHYIANARL